MKTSQIIETTHNQDCLQKSLQGNLITNHFHGFVPFSNYSYTKFPTNPKTSAMIKVTKYNVSILDLYFF